MSTPGFRLRFKPSRIRYWAGRYHVDGEDELIARVRASVAKLGYFSQQDFLDTCRWKSPRTRKRCESNSAEFIKAVTQTALSTNDERLRIEVLTLLSGVSWPTASVLLHFGFWDQYPILDFRALWSLRVDVPNQYAFGFWECYTDACRQIARKAQVDMRTLDRALWQYSKGETRLTVSSVPRRTLAIAPQSP